MNRFRRYWTSLNIWFYRTFRFIGAPLQRIVLPQYSPDDLVQIIASLEAHPGWLYVTGKMRDVAAIAYYDLKYAQAQPYSGSLADTIKINRLQEAFFWATYLQRQIENATKAAKSAQPAPEAS